MLISDELRNDFNECRKLTKSCSSSYYYSTLLFPRKIRRETFALYTFFRIFDEDVDNPKSESIYEIQETLRRRINSFYRDLERGYSDEKYFRAIIHTLKSKNVPKKYLEAFFTAMMSDLFIKEYKSYADLQAYMYGSANIVGILMCYLFDRTDQKTLYYAEKLGEAFQFTNFLRDIDEDFTKRDRIYIPLQDLERFGIEPAQFKNGFGRDQFLSLWEFEKNRNIETYREAKKGIKRLPLRVRLPIRLAIAAYKRHIRRPRVRFAGPDKAPL
jgi:phytoene synthase